MENTRKSWLRVIAALLTVLMLAAMPMPRANAAAVENGYYYPNYSTSSGYVDLMRYVKDVSLSANDSLYTEERLALLRTLGQTPTLDNGQTVTLNFTYSLCGRSYGTLDRTRLNSNSSAKVCYTHDTQTLGGQWISAGETAVLDDSSLMRVCRTPETSVLRMNIEWLLAICPNGFTAEGTDERIAFKQGTGANKNYLYAYFPQGIGSSQYAETGGFFITFKMTNSTDSIRLPASNNYWGSNGWEFPVNMRQNGEGKVMVSDVVGAHGDIRVDVVWANGNDSQNATIELSYKQHGLPMSSTRTIRGSGSTSFTIQNSMTDCTLSARASGYTASIKSSDYGRTYTVTLRPNGSNTGSSGTGSSGSTKTGGIDLKGGGSATGSTNGGSLNIALRSAAGGDMASGKFSLYRLESAEDARGTLVEGWTTTDSPKQLKLAAGSYRLREAQAPIGYALINDLRFTVDAKGNVQLESTKQASISGSTLTVVNVPLEVCVKRVDANGAPVYNAVLELRDAYTGELVDSWLSDGTTRTITYIGGNGVVLNQLHSFVIVESVTPEGASTPAPYQFTINGDGTIRACPHHTVTMKG